jgi:hypothetical protein
MTGTSSKFRSLLRRLLDGTARSTSPVFQLAELQAIDPYGCLQLRKAKVLLPCPVPEAVDHPVHGRLLTRQVGRDWYLIDPEAPAQDWLKVTDASLEHVLFQHQRMLKWLAELAGTAGEEEATGDLWVIGTTLAQGRRCHLLYHAGTASASDLLSAVRQLGPASPGTHRIILAAAPIRFGSGELEELDAAEISVDFLYNLLTPEGLELDHARLPHEPAQVPACYFRRSGDGKSWQLGFETTTPLGHPHGVALDRIWLLLRNPGRNFSAADITAELNGTSSDRSMNGRKEASSSPTRSAGTAAKKFSDLLPDQQDEGRTIREDLTAAREAHGEDSFEFREADKDMKDFLKKFGIKDTYQGQQKREGDDQANEAAAIKRSINRWIADSRNGPLANLAAHLDSSISRESFFRYEPAKCPRWLT